MQFNIHDLYNFVILSTAVFANLAYSFITVNFFVKKIKKIYTAFEVTTKIKLRKEHMDSDPSSMLEGYFKVPFLDLSSYSSSK